MTTYKRICIKEETFIDEDKSITLHRGEEYITSEVRNGKVQVFSTYWFIAPQELFAGEVKFT